MGVERSRPQIGPVAPDFTQELFLREDAPGVGGELRQELELLAGHMDVPAGDGHGAGDAVDHELAHLVALRWAWGDPTQDRPDPSDELVVDERRNDVVVGAAGERTHAIEDV